MLSDQLALGRPDHAQIVFGRKITSRTPGRFRTRVITTVCSPRSRPTTSTPRSSSTSRRGRALQNRDDDQRPQRLRHRQKLLSAENWNALTDQCSEVNQRLLDAQLAACDCAPDSITLQQIVSPSVHDGQKAPALRFGDQSVMALFSCLCAFRHLFAGHHQRQPARAHGRAHPGLQRPPDDLRPAPPAAQRPHPPRSPKATATR